MPGFNYRRTEFQGALGLTQMAKLARIIAARREKAAAYDRLLAGGPIEAPFVPVGSQPVYQSYVVLLPEAVMDRRAAASQQLRQLGIETTIGTWHMPLTPISVPATPSNRAIFPSRMLFLPVPSPCPCMNF